MKSAFIDSCIGILKISTDESENFISCVKCVKSKENTTDSCSVLDKAVEELKMYFEGRLKKFTVPVLFSGTSFQESVWKALMDIPYGETRSYKDIATIINKPKASRAVGMANNKNNIIIIVPCHRVIGKNGDMVGFGAGIDKKIALLELEKQNRDK